MTKVLIVGESEVLRRGLESLVAATPSLELIGSVEDLSEIGQWIRETTPDVVLAAVSSLEQFIHEAEMLLRSESPPQLAFVVLASDSPAISSLEPLRAGIAALLRRDATMEEILAAIHAATLGLIVLDPAMMESEKEEEVAPYHLVPGARVPQLTARELEVLTMLAEGLGNKEIAWRLKISEHTVKFHLSSIFSKLDVSSRAEAVSIGFRLGLILL